MQTWNTASSHDLPQLKSEGSICQDYALLSEQVWQIEQLKPQCLSLPEIINYNKSVLPNLTRLYSPILSDSQTALQSFIVQESVTCSFLWRFFNSLTISPGVNENRTSNNQSSFVFCSLYSDKTSDQVAFVLCWLIKLH